MRRRRFLATLPPAVGFAGCRGDPAVASPRRETADGENASDSGGENRSDTVPGNRPSTEGSGRELPTRIPEDAVPTGTVGRAVAARLRSAYRHVVNVDGIRVVAPERDQFLFVYPPSGEGGTASSPEPANPPETRRLSTPEGPPTDAFTLLLDGRPFAPVSMPPRYRSRTPGIGSVYVDGSPDGWLMFDVPTVETDSAALVHEGARYPLPDGAVERLATAPSFRLASVSVPESVAPDETVELGLTVENVGDREGTYLAGFRWSGLPKPVEVTVPPGESGSASVWYRVYGDGSMRFAFDYPGGDRVYEVEIANGTPNG